MMSSQTSSHAVLLVDDCEEHCLLTARALRLARPATHCVSLDNGDAAIRHLGAADRPELLLLDWRMPGCSGEEVLAWARSQPHLTGLPILIVSGVGFPEDRQRAAELGANGYLIKPNSFEGYQTLARDVDGWRDRLTAEAAEVVQKPPAALTPSHWERSARVVRAMVGAWGWMASAKREISASEYIDTPADQLTADLVRLCRAQGIVPRDILQPLPAGDVSSPLAFQRRTIIRGLARRGWDTHELAEIFPLTPAAIRLLVRRRA